MIFGAVVGIATLVPVAVLALVDRRGGTTRPAAAALGAMSGGLGGAGILVGAIHQPTTANIHSGYSFAGVLEWLLLVAGGGLLGVVVGGALGWRLPRWRPALALLLAVALGGAVGWVVSSSRSTIDCDDRPSFCDERYG